ncbi:MAG TPA: hypothetical protein VFA32_17775, partial [Dehalococcoidia bacterium]|nr:hypothetical protein [Dehalococcoidia bacterium]
AKQSQKGDCFVGSILFGLLAMTVHGPFGTDSGGVKDRAIPLPEVEVVGFMAADVRFQQRADAED